MPRLRTSRDPKPCCRCKRVLGEEAFTPSVWARNSGACNACNNEAARKKGPRVIKHHRGFIRCPECLHQLGADHFTPAAWAKGSGRCLSCHNAKYGSIAGLEQQKKLSKYTRERKRKKVAFVMAEKAKRGCMFCKENHPAALDFHHRDKGHKTATVRGLIDRDRSLVLIEEEMAKCDVVCANCHRKLHYAEGGASYWGKDQQQRPEVVEEAEAMREQRNRDYPVHLKLA